MVFTPRIRQVLLILLKERQAVPVQVLADKMGLSKRTVQRELEYVNNSLKDSGVRFLSKAGSGVWLEGRTEDMEALWLELQEGDPFDTGNRNERRKRLILEILKEKGLKKLYYYSSKFKVSEATISGDLEAVEAWLSQFGLSIIRKPGSGIYIDGSEENYRRAIRTFVEENLDTHLLAEPNMDETPLDPLFSLQQSGLRQLLNDDILKRVVSCISHIDEEKTKKLTESSYIGLILHLTIAVNRILNHDILEDDAKWQDGLQKDENYALAVRIADAMEAEFNIRFPAVEISYICLHLKAAKHEKLQWNDQEFTEIGNRGFPQLVNEMVEAFDPEASYWLKQDVEFLQGLLAHLQPTIVRILYHMQIANPILDSVKQEYPEVYQKCRQAAAVLERWLNQEVPETEIGFLAVHFGAAMVRLEGYREELRQVQVGVVCSSGIGVSRLMSTKLSKEFRKRIKISVYGKKEITPYIEGKTDFFVSSIPLEPQEIPVVFVNPLLNEADMEEIRKLVSKYERMPKKGTKDSGSFLQLETINLMAAQINSIVKYMDFFQVKEAITFDELLSVIGKRNSPHEDCSTVIQEDLRKREQLTSQIFAEFGFGLLHAQTEGVTRPSFSVCMTESLRPFSDAYLKNVKVIFIMLIPYDENVGINSEILGYISSILIEDTAFMKAVLAGDFLEMQDCLALELKTFFKGYLSKIS